ncbi:S-layer homology domain-containing protein, partial [Lysinibacillus antri]
MKKKSKKLLNATIASAVVASAVVVVAPNAVDASTKFPDLKGSEYYYDSVINLTERGIIKGFPDGTFGPTKLITRGQAAQIIAGSLGLDTKNVNNPKFTDVSTTNWAYGAIAALTEAKIVSGYPDRTYQSDRYITRNEMAIMIAKAYQLKSSNDVELPFNDVNPQFEQYINALYTNNVTAGISAMKYSGTANVTRGELATFVTRAESAMDAIEENNTTFTISEIAGTKVEGFDIPEALRGLLNEKNSAALAGAFVKAEIKDGKIVAINSLQLNTAGKEGAVLILDGGNTTIKGDLLVNADYIEVKNLTVQGNVSLSSNVVNGFTADGLVNNGEFIVEEATNPVASLTPFFAAATNGPVIDFKNSNLNKVHVKRDNVTVGSDAKLPELTISANVSSIQVDADVTTVTVDVTIGINITGSGSFDQVALEKAVEVALNISGTIAKLAVNNPEAKVEVDTKIKIGEVTLPADSNAKDIIKNYESIQSNIAKVVAGDNVTTPGTNNGSANPGGSGSSGGSGGGSGSTGGGDQVTVTSVQATVGDDGKKITITANVTNTTATKATIEFYKVENGVVASAPLSTYTREPNIVNGKVNFESSELPKGTYQVKVTVGSVTGIATQYVTVTNSMFVPGKTSTTTVTDGATVKSGSNDQIATIKIEGTTLTATSVAVGEFTVTLTDDKQYRVSVDYSGNVQVTVSDQVAPTVTHTPSDYGVINEPINISVDVTDNVGVTSVKLFYKTPSETTYTEVSMNKGVGSNYNYDIPEVSANSIQYYIEAKDAAGNTKKFADKENPSEIKLLTYLDATQKAINELLEVTEINGYKYAELVVGVDENKVALVENMIEQLSEGPEKESLKTKVNHVRQMLGLKITELTVEEINNTVELQWNAVEGANGYEVYYYQGDSAPSNPYDWELAWGNGERPSVNNFTISGLQNDKYVFKVVAFKNDTDYILYGYEYISDFVTLVDQPAATFAFDAQGGTVGETQDDVTFENGTFTIAAGSTLTTFTFTVTTGTVDAPVVTNYTATKAQNGTWSAAPTPVAATFAFDAQGGTVGETQDDVTFENGTFTIAAGSTLTTFTFTVTTGTVDAPVVTNYTATK